MKLQCGAFYRDNKQTTLGDSLALLGSYNSWNGETSGEISNGSLLMLYRGDRLTYEDDNEVQPFQVEPNCWTFDGRLDNREEMADAGGVTSSHNISDLALVARAFERCGEAIFSKLIGEFALVLWQSKARALTFVRSVDGSRPLYYMTDKDRLMWSSDIAHLVRMSREEPTLNAEYIFEYLVFDPLPQNTPFSAIKAVTPGRTLRFVNDAFVQGIALWEPRNISPLEYRSDAEYEEAFRIKIAEAVRVRLRAKGTVALESSGGLDSSSAVSLAAELRDLRGPYAQRLMTLSTVYEKSRTCDERYFIELVQKRCGIETFYVHEEEQQFTAAPTNLTFTGIPNGFDTTPGRFPRFIEYMKEQGARILLTGVGGDHIFCSEVVPEALVADLIQGRQLVEAHRACKTWSRFKAVPYFTLMLKRAVPLALGSLLPEVWRYETLRLPPWINLHGTKELLTRLSMISPEPGLAPTRRLRLGAVDGFFRAISSGRWNAYPYLYVSHPYNHRPLVEFCLAVPTTQHLRPGQTRSLLRRALADLLPAKIRKRKGKGVIYEALARALQRDWTVLGDIAQWQVCLSGYVKEKELRDCLFKMRMGVDDVSGSAIRAITLERFLRSLSLIRQDNKQSYVMAS
jgi:asparagine synthase (glutamine-hydrolysing)